VFVALLIRPALLGKRVRSWVLNAGDFDSVFVFGSVYRLGRHWRSAASLQCDVWKVVCIQFVSQLKLHDEPPNA